MKTKREVLQNFQITNRWYLGVDPGKGGGLCLLREDQEVMHLMAMQKYTPAEIVLWLQTNIRTYNIVHCVMEKVHSSPQMGVVSAFTFGHATGYIEGVLASCSVGYELVRPQRWQTALGCLTKGDKKVSKVEAHRRWPWAADRLTHAVADAALIACYALVTTRETTHGLV